MKVEVYQLPIENHLKYRSYATIESSGGIDNLVYDKVWEGELPDGTPDDVFEILNNDQPEDYEAPSLSVSDIIVIKDGPEEYNGSHFCDKIGFKDLDFEGETNMDNEELMNNEPDLSDITDEDDALASSQTNAPADSGADETADDDIKGIQEMFNYHVGQYNTLNEGRYSYDWNPDDWDGENAYDAYYDTGSLMDDNGNYRENPYELNPYKKEKVQRGRGYTTLYNDEEDEEEWDDDDSDTIRTEDEKMRASSPYEQEVWEDDTYDISKDINDVRETAGRRAASEEKQRKAVETFTGRVRALQDKIEAGNISREDALDKFAGYEDALLNVAPDKIELIMTHRTIIKDAIEAAKEKRADKADPTRKDSELVSENFQALMGESLNEDHSKNESLNPSDMPEFDKVVRNEVDKAFNKLKSAGVIDNDGINVIVKTVSDRALGRLDYVDEEKIDSKTIETAVKAEVEDIYKKVSKEAGKRNPELAKGKKSSNSRVDESLNEGASKNDLLKVVLNYFRESYVRDAFIKVAVDILDRALACEGESNSDKAWEAIDEGLIYSDDQWEVVRCYCDINRVNLRDAEEQFAADIETMLGSIGPITESLNEDRSTWLPTDKEESDLIRSAGMKIANGKYNSKTHRVKRAALTPEEQSVLDKYDLRPDYHGRAAKGHIEGAPSRDCWDAVNPYDCPPYAIESDYRTYENPNINIIDKLRKDKERGEKDRAVYGRAHRGGDRKYINALDDERRWQNIEMGRDRRDMKDDLWYRNHSSRELLDAAKRRDAAIAKANDDFNSTTKYYTDRLKDANNRIDKLLKRK